MILLLLVLTFVSTFFLIQQPKVQTWLVHKAGDYLSREMGSEVKVDSVNIRFLSTLEIYNVYLSSKTSKTDTILYVGKLNAGLMIGRTLWDQIVHIRDKKIYVDNIELDHVRFNGFRAENDSLYNFSFILAQFASKDTTQKKTPSKPIELRLNSVSITNSHLVMDDHFGDKKLDISLTKAHVKLREFNINHLKIDAKTVELVDPKFVLTLYNQKIKAPDPHEAPGKGFDVQGIGKSLNLTVDEISMQNGTYGMDMQHRDTKAGSFKISQMNIHDINFAFKDYRWDSSGMHVAMKDMKVIGDNNLNVKQLQGKVLLSNGGIFLDNATIAYNDTKLIGNFGLKFTDEWRSFSDFENKVILQADIHDAHATSKDVAVFAPAAQKFVPASVNVHGLVKGKLSNLRVDRLFVAAGKNTVIDISGNIKGLPHINQTLFDLSVNQIRTTSTELKQLLTFVKLPPQIDSAGAIAFKGSYFGFINDFVAKGSLNTGNLGNLVTDIRMSFPKGKAPTYSGSVSARGLNLAALSGNSKLLRNVDIDLSLNGQGFNTKELDSRLNGTIRNFYFNGFMFDQIQVDGLIDKKKFSGKAFYDDSCFLIDFNGVADFNDTIPKFDFKTSIKNADLHKLNLSKDSLMISLDGTVHFAGNNFDNLAGTGKFSNLILQNNKDILALSDVDIDLENDGTLKNYTLRSDQFNATVKGLFDPLTLVPTMKVYLSQYSKLIKPTEKDLKQAKPTQLDAAIKIKSDIGLFQVFLPDLKYISELDLNANIDTRSHLLKLDASMDSANYGGMIFNKLRIDGNTDDKNLLLHAGMGNLNAEKMNFPDIRLDANSSLEQLLTDIHVASDTADNSVMLQSSLDFNGDTVITRILDSRLKLNNKVWSVIPGNQLTIIDSIFLAQNLSLVQGDQRINIQNGRNTLSDAKINVENLDLVDVGRLADSSGAVRNGKLSGTINLKNILTKLQANVDLTVNDLQILDYKVKYIGLDGVYGRNGKNIVEAGGTIEDNDYQLSFDGTYDMQVKGQEKLNVDADIEKLNLQFLETILKKELLVPHAFVKGQVNVSGNLSTPILTGKAQIIDTAELKLRFLGTTFKMVNEEIDLTPKGFDFGEITLYDNYGNTALLTGKLLHTGFKDFKVEKANLSAPTGYNFMNTTYEDNQDFYGKVFAKGDVDINGYFDDLNINVNQLETLKNSDFNLPVTSQSSSDKGYTFIRFVNPKDSTQHIEYKSKVSGINLNMNITATQDANINIILDPNTNDKISARGDGNLNLTLSKNGNIGIDGTYNLVSGKYDFNFQGVLNKTFKIRPGSSINFSGDPMKAEMNITGLYNVPAASVRNIVDSNSAIKNRTFPIDLNLLVTGTLEKPKVGFKISPTPGSVSSQSDELVRKLDEITVNETEVNNQAVALLLFNTFFPTSTSSDQRFSGASNTVTQLVSSQLSNLFSRGLEKLIPGASLDLLLSDLESKESRNFGFSYKQELFSSRLILTIGGNVNFGSTNTTVVSTTGQPANNSNIVGDFVLEYLVTPDGRIRLKTYAKTANYDIINQDKIRTGGSVSFQKEFDNLKDLFRTKKKSDQQQSSAAPVTPKKEEPPVQFQPAPSNGQTK